MSVDIGNRVAKDLLKALVRLIGVVCLVVVVWSSHIWAATTRKL